MGSKFWNFYGEGGIFKIVASLMDNPHYIVLSITPESCLLLMNRSERKSRHEVHIFNAFPSWIFYCVLKIKLRNHDQGIKLLLCECRRKLNQMDVTTFQMVSICAFVLFVKKIRQIVKLSLKC